jgi:hypothetical protein
MRPFGKVHQACGKRYLFMRDFVVFITTASNKYYYDVGALFSHSIRSTWRPSFVARWE